MKKKYGFTLAEVLVTLSILGVVAAIMIPSTIQKFQDRAQITGLKRAYSMLDNAFSIAVIENGRPMFWNGASSDNTATQNRNVISETIKNYLPIKKYCGMAKDCINYKKDHKLKLLNGNEWTSVNFESMGAKMHLKNNMFFAIENMNDIVNGYNNGSIKKSVAQIFIDINDIKGPNRLGYDIFRFYMDVDGNIYPHSNKVDCENSNKNGWSCSSWIIRHNNMDYKYRDVSSEW